MKIKLNTLFFSKALGFFLLLLMLSTRVYAQKSTTIKSCLSNQSTEEATKTALLQQAKQQAIGQLFGETVSKETTSHERLSNDNGKENFNSDFDITSSSSMVGGVHVQGNPTYNRKGFGQYCISATLYATDEAIKRYSTTPIALPPSNNKACADSKEKAVQQSSIALLTNYYGSLKHYSDQQLLGLLHQVKHHVTSDNISAGGRYCVIATAKIVPREIEILKVQKNKLAQQEEIKAKREKAAEKKRQAALKAEQQQQAKAERQAEADRRAKAEAEEQIQNELKGWTLHKAARVNNLRIAKLLIDKGANVDAKSNNGFAPLHTAARYNATETARLLIDKGANVDAEDNNGTTPLHIAAWKNATETARLLIDKGANVNAKSNNGFAPLHTAARYNATETARLLIDEGAEVDAESRLGNTPLHRAAQKNATETARLLIDEGADVNAKSNNGRTPLYWAKRKNNPKTARLLRAYGGHR